MGIRQYALVKIDEEFKSWLIANSPESPMLEEESFLFMGEVPNMPEHCAVAGATTGKVYIGFHTDNFVELSEGEC